MLRAPPSGDWKFVRTRTLESVRYVAHPFQLNIQRSTSNEAAVSDKYDLEEEFIRIFSTSIRTASRERGGSHAKLNVECWTLQEGKP